MMVMDPRPIDDQLIEGFAILDRLGELSSELMKAASSSIKEQEDNDE